MELTRSSMDDMLGVSERELVDKEAGRRFLDFYGDEGIRLALDRYGIGAALRRRGYDGFDIETRAMDDRHTLIVHGHTPHEDPSTRRRLIELVVRRDRLVPHEVPGLPSLAPAYDVLTVDWLLLQDPLASFTPERPRLPGQEAPGLGVGERVLELLYRIVERLKLHALVTVAEYFHNAVLYARELPLFDPSHGGRLRALEHLLLEKEGLSLAQASWAMEWGFVRGADDAVVKWKGEAQVRAFDPQLVAWLTGEAHHELQGRACTASKFVLDRTWLDERWSAEKDIIEGKTEG